MSRLLEMIQDRHRIASDAGDTTMAHHDRGHLLAEVKRLVGEREAATATVVRVRALARTLLAEAYAAEDADALLGAVDAFWREVIIADAVGAAKETRAGR